MRMAPCAAFPMCGLHWISQAARGHTVDALRRFFIKTEGGKKVSFWDLYRYVYHNPELKALVDNRRADIPLADEGESALSS